MKKKMAMLLLLLFMLMQHSFADNGIKMEAVVGYDGEIGVYRQMPLEIHIDNQGQDLKGTLEITFPVGENSIKKQIIDVELAAASKKTIKTTFYPTTLRAQVIQYELKTQSGKVAEGEVRASDFYSDQEPAIAVISEKEENDFYLGNADFKLADNLRNFVERGYEKSTSEATTANKAEVIKLHDLEYFSDLELLSGFDALYIKSTQDLALDDKIANNLFAWLNNGGTLMIENASDYKKIYNQLPENLRLAGLDNLKFKEINLILAKDEIKGETLDYDKLKRSDADKLLAISGIGVGVETLVGEGAIINFAPLSTDIDYLNQVLRTANDYRYVDDKFSFRYHDIRDYINYIDGIEFPYQTLASILVLYTLVVGFLLYVVLIKLKKRDYYWFAAPAIAVLTMILMAMVSRSAFGNEAIVNSFSTLTYNGSGEVIEINSMLAVFNNKNSELSFTYGKDKKLREYEDRYDYYPDDSKNNLISQKTLGDKIEVVDYQTSLWDRKFLTAKQVVTAENSFAKISYKREKAKHLVEFENQTPLHLKHAKLYYNGAFYELGEINSFSDYSYNLADLDKNTWFSYHHRSDYKGLDKDERDAMRFESILRDTIRKQKSYNQTLVLGYNEDYIDYGLKVNHQDTKQNDKNLVIFNLDMQYQKGSIVKFNNENLMVHYDLGDGNENADYGVVSDEQGEFIEIYSPNWDGVIDFEFGLPDKVKLNKLIIKPELYFYTPKEEFVLDEDNLLGKLSIFSYKENAYVELPWQDGKDVVLNPADYIGENGIMLRTTMSSAIDLQKVLDANSDIIYDEEYFFKPLEIQLEGEIK